MRQRSSTAMAPRSSTATPRAPRGRAPSLCGRRPTATSTRSKRSRALIAELDLDAAADLAHVAHRRSGGARPRTACRMRRASGWTRSRSTPGRSAVRHLDERHLAAERGVDLCRARARCSRRRRRAAAAGTSASSSAAVESITRSLAPRCPASAAGADPVAIDRVLEADLLRLVALDAQRPRVLEDGAAADDLDACASRHAREPARELADHALGLPLAERIERDRAARRTRRRILAARSASCITAATCSSAFDGMHPSKRHAPPSRLPASTTTVSRPSSARGTPPSSRPDRRPRRRRPPLARDRPSPWS